MIEQSAILPELPPDVWGVILRSATCVPHILDPDSVFEFCSFTHERKRLLKASLLTKRNVVRVCKQWNFLAVPYLYESLIIKRSRTITSLQETLHGLRRAANTPMDTGPPLGWWTKRFDIAIYDVGGDIHNELVFLSEIIRCLPNLTIITLCITAHRYRDATLPPYFLPTLSASNLKAIIWFNHHVQPNADDWYTFLRRSGGSLRTVYCPAIKFPPDFLPAMPAVQTSYTPEALTAIQVYNPPLVSLRHAIFEVDHYHPECNSGWKQVLWTCGVNLSVIQVYFAASSTIETISQTFFNLQRLDISVAYWAVLLAAAPSFPATIRTLGMHSLQVQAPRGDVNMLFSTLTNKTKFKFGSRLQVIQFLRKGTVIDLCRNHQPVLSWGIPLLKNRGIEVHDHEGQVMKY